MGKMAGRPLLQNLVKEAISGAAAKVQVAEEARLQDKTAAAEKCEKCGKEKDACMCSKQASIGSPQAAAQVEKLANACDYAAQLLKEAASMGGAYSLTEHVTPMPPGVSQATASTSLPDKKGQGVHTVPMHPATDGSAMKNTLTEAPELHHEQMQTNYGKKHAAEVALIRATLGKTASDAEKKETKGLEEVKKGLETAEAAHKSEPENKTAASAVPDELVTWLLSRTKVAEDALNPAQIHAGKAVPPQTSAAGEAGGAPAGGPPQGPRGLVASNTSAAAYKKDQAYANRKADLGKYFSEPALSGQHDSVLRDAFAHTPQAGTKFASAQPSTAAAAKRVLLSKLAEAANQDAQGAAAPAGAGQ